MDENGTFFRAPDDSDIQYVGPPSSKVDKAWSDLLWGLNIDLTHQEMGSDYSKTFQWDDDSLFFTGVDVFHSLHCLNRIRQALNAEYYSWVFSSFVVGPSLELHMEHCIDYLRQAIQCHSDLTPMLWERRGNKLLLKMDTLHTCRNFETIHEWAKGKVVNGSKKSLASGELLVVD